MSRDCSQDHKKVMPLVVPFNISADIHSIFIWESIPFLTNTTHLGSAVTGYLASQVPKIIPGILLLLLFRSSRLPCHVLVVFNAPICRVPSNAKRPISYFISNASIPC